MWRWGLVIPLPAAVPDVAGSLQWPGICLCLPAQSASRNWCMAGRCSSSQSWNPTAPEHNRHSAGIPVGRTCDVQFVAKEDVVSDVYAGHDLIVPRRDRTDDWRVVINTLPVWAGYPGAGQGLQTHDFKLMSWHMLYKLIKVGVDGTTVPLTNRESIERDVTEKAGLKHSCLRLWIHQPMGSGKFLSASESLIPDWHDQQEVEGTRHRRSYRNRWWWWWSDA